MPERYVFCGGLKAGRGRPNALHLDVNAPASSPSRVNLEIDDLCKKLAGNIPDVLTDMLEIAVYVYCADQFTKRGTIRMTRMGAEWRRQFRFMIPVRRRDIWIRPKVREALIETLGFLSEDEFDFEFVEASNPRPLQAYLPLEDPEAQKISPDEIILFSGGLDSLAGAVNGMIGAGKQVVLVSHQPSKMIASKQYGLIADLRNRTKARSLFHVPVRANKGQEEAAEFTQRTRSLLFATFGFIVARMFHRPHLSIYENGIVSINLPIAEHIIGSRASRTTHPRVLADFSRLFSLLTSHGFTVENPFLWKTKTDVVRVLSDRNCADLISRAFSCTRVREATKTSKHCGVCSQCIDRRFGILAADLSGHDPTANYVVDPLTGAHKPGPALTMIESYVLRAQKLATMSQQSFVATYGQVFRAIPHLPGSADENVGKLWDLHRRHGQEVISVVDKELQNNASVSGMLELPISSLLAMVVSPVAKQPDYADPVEAEPSAAQQVALDKQDYTWEPILIAVDSEKRKIVFEGGVEFGGSMFELIAALAEQHEADLRSGTVPEDYTFVKAKTLAKRLGIGDQSFRQCVSRSRKRIEGAFLRAFDRQLAADDVIQNQGWNGYRLNPYLLLVAAAKVREPRPMSQVGARGVTLSTVAR